MASDDTHNDDLPEDPFKIDVPDFENFTGPHAEEVRKLVHTFAAAKTDFFALVRQPSFRELGIAVSALDEKRAQAVLLRAIATCVAHYMNDRERFARWAEAQ